MVTLFQSFVDDETTQILTIMADFIEDEKVSNHHTFDFDHVPSFQRPGIFFTSAIGNIIY